MGLLNLPSKVFEFLVDIKNDLYEKNWRPVYRAPCPVISVGNLSVGGTGKTPVVHALLAWAESQGLQFGVISRGYGGSYKGVEEVQDSSEAAIHFGDEPALTKRKFPAVPFFVSAARKRAIETLLQRYSVQALLLDDGFQHRQVYRDLDIVLVDASQESESWNMLPKGKFREPWSSLARADFVILTKWNLASIDIQKKLLEKVKTHSSSRLKAVLKSEISVGSVSGLGKGHQVLEDGASVHLVSGIGNPKSFTSIVEGRYQVLDHRVFPDHHKFSPMDFEQLPRPILVTEKDAVKIGALDIDLNEVYVAELNLNFNTEVEVLFAEIRKTLT